MNRGLSIAFSLVLLGCGPSANDGDAGNGDAGNGDAPLSPTSEEAGRILIQHGVMRGLVMRFYSTGGYYSSLREDRCTLRTVSPACTLVSCFPAPSFPNRTAGTVELEVPGIETLQLMPDAAGEYAFDSAAWRSLTDVVVRASGADVAAFTATVTMPEPPTVLASPTEARRSEGLTLAFSAGVASPSVRITVPASAPTTYPTFELACTASAGSTSLVVSSTELSALPPGVAEVEVLSAQRVFADASGVPVEVLAVNQGPEPQQFGIMLRD